MSTINPIALYQTETFGNGFQPYRHNARREDTDNRQKEAPMSGSPTSAPRSVPFIAQLIVGNDSDLRRPLSRRDIAEQREAAYGAALANRPSARPLSFLRIVASV